MSNSVKVYAPNEVSSVFGPIIHDGFGPDTFIEVEWDNPITDDEAGVDGEVAISRNYDQRANVKITLMQTSNVNDQMAVMANLAINAPGMTGAIHPYALKDNNGRTLLESPNAWVKERPQTKFERKAGTKTWNIRCSHLAGIEGGN